ncbi:MAG: FtsW/RodA/SpoVE family cell cycle protein [Anaerolineales bacterium]
MGAGTLAATEHAPARNPASRSQGPDLALLVAVIILIAFGLIMVYSASWDYSLAEYGEAAYMFMRQLLWLALGLVIAALLTVFDYHHWRRLIVPAMGLTIVLLIAVLLLNEIRLGAKRSLYAGSYQPSELAKIVTIVYLSVWLYAKRRFLHDISLGLVPLGMILGVVGGLIYQQPDLSAAGTLLIMGGLLFFLAGGDLKQIGLLLVVAVVAGYLVVQVSPTGRVRVAEFLAGLKDPTQASYHVQRSYEAIVNGGVFGVGIGRAQSKLTGLPVPPTDSIYAVVVEELGLLGAVTLIGLYALVVWRGLIIARRAPDMLGTLLATGLVVWIGLEAGINMMVMVGLLPFAGNALPFVSAGGSNLVSSLAAVGILLNVSRQRGPWAADDEDEEGRPDLAPSRVRRWHRRRRVSRAGGATSLES